MFRLAITKINPAWLPNLGKSLCTFSRPLEMPSSSIKIKASTTSAPQQDPNTREAFVTPHYGDLGIDLPAMKVTQKKDRGRWITQLWMRPIPEIRHRMQNISGGTLEFESTKHFLMAEVDYFATLVTVT
jgi:hypothetical protein